MEGISIAVAGMAIVSVALALISLFIAALPHVLAVVSQRWPETEAPHARPARGENLVSDNSAILAAIGYVLHCEIQQQLSDKPTVAKNG